MHNFLITLKPVYKVNFVETNFLNIQFNPAFGLRVLSVTPSEVVRGVTKPKVIIPYPYWSTTGVSSVVEIVNLENAQLSIVFAPSLGLVTGIVLNITSTQHQEFRATASYPPPPVFHHGITINIDFIEVLHTFNSVVNSIRTLEQRLAVIITLRATDSNQQQQHRSEQSTQHGRIDTFTDQVVSISSRSANDRIG